MTLKPPDSSTGTLITTTGLQSEIDNLFVNANASPYNAVPGANQSSAIQAAINAAASSGVRWVGLTLPGTYLLDTTLDLSAGNIAFRLAPGVILDYSGVTAVSNKYYAIKARGTVGAKVLLTANGTRQALTVTVADASSFTAGNYVEVGTQSPVSTLNGAIVSAVSTADITLTDATGFTVGASKIFLAVGGECVSYTGRTANVFTGIVRGVDGTTATTHLNGTYAVERNDTKSYPSYRTNLVADRGEIKRIDTISGGTITFEEALYDAYPTSNRAFIRKLTMVDNVTVDLNGGKITGSTIIAQTKLEYGIDFTYVNGFVVKDGKIENTRMEGVRVLSCLEGQVTGVRFRGTSLYTDTIETTYGGDWYGVGISASSHSISVTDCKAEFVRRLSATFGYGAGQDFFGQPRSITWENNISRAAHTEMFEQHGWGEDVICCGNVSEGGFGLARIEGGGITVENNTVRGFELYGIVISGDIREARDITIRNNRIRERAGIGDASARAIMCDFTGVTVIEDVEVSGNIINWDLTDRAAISTNSAVIVAADNFVIQDNRIMCNAARSTYAIDIYTPDTIIRSNVIRGSRYGIRVNADRCEVANNIVTMSTQNAVGGDAVNVAGVDNVRVVGNTIRFTFQAITVAASSDDTIVQNNTFRVPHYLRGIVDSGNRTVGYNNYLEGDTPGDQQVASAATVTLPIKGNLVWRVTGTTNITSVTIQAANTVITLKFDGALTFTAGGNLKLAGNFVTTADDTITLMSNGSNWYEMSRSANA